MLNILDSIFLMAQELFMDNFDTYSFPVDVYSYEMFSINFTFEGRNSRSQQLYMMWTSKDQIDQKISLIIIGN